MAQRDLIYGHHAVAAVLRRDPACLLEICIAEGARPQGELSRILEEARRIGLRIRTAPRKELDVLTSESAHQGIVAWQKPSRAHSEADLDALLTRTRCTPLLLILDGLKDPHNLGACLRSADAAGAHAVIAPKDRATGLTPVVRKVASGAAESLPFIQVTNLARTLRHLKQQGIWLVGADAAAEQNLYQTDLTGPVALVMGAEGEGLRRLTRDHCDFLARIPMAGAVASLNVSVAAGICLFEAVRQRGLG